MERVCEKTEFEVEGWRKIPPLINILQEQNIPFDEQARMKLKMNETEPFFEKNVFEVALNQLDSTKLRIRESRKNPDNIDDGKTIKHSWIYKHFKDDSTKQSKIAIYVNAIMPINQNLDVSELNHVGNHCVIVSGLAKWPKNHPDGIECLELENNGGCEETRFIPVDFPFFEEIQIDANKIRHETQNKGQEFYETRMNKLGKKLVERKWGKFQTIEKDWYDKKRALKDGQKIVNESNQQSKYELLFVRGRSSCFQLEFTS